MIMYTAKTASSGSPTERTIADRPSRAPTSTHRRSDGTGSHSSSGDGQREQEQEQHVGHDQVLELDLEPVVEHRHRGQRGQPGRSAEPVPGQRVDHHRDGQRHQVLQYRYDGIAVQRLQDLQVDRVPGRPGRIQLEVDRVLHVLERVVEPGLPPVAELGVDPEQHGGSEHDDEQAVPGPGASGRARAPAQVVQPGLAGRRGQARCADGSRDGAAGITLKPYPPVLGQ